MVVTKKSSAAWPTEDDTMLYSPIGDATSAVHKSPSRLTTEFTIGTGLSHLSDKGLKYYYDKHKNKSTNKNDDNGNGNQDRISSSDAIKQYYNQDGRDFMKHHTLTSEGLHTSPATNGTFLETVLLLTDAPHRMRFFVQKNQTEIHGLNCARDGVILTSGVMFKEDTIGELEDSFILDFDPDEPVLRRIELQSCTYLDNRDTDSRNKGTIEKRVTYLQLVTTAKTNHTVTFGSKHTPGFDNEGVIYSPLECIAGSNYVISGIGYNSQNCPIMFQIVDLGTHKNITERMETCVYYDNGKSSSSSGNANDTDNDHNVLVDIMDTCVYYNDGVISGNFIRDTQQLMDVEYGNSIIMEDGSILYGDKSIVHNCMKAIGRSNPSCGELLPNTVDLFERSLNGDLQSIHTVFRLDRYLSYIIQNRQPIVALNYSMDTTTTTATGDDGGEQQHEWNHYSKLIPMKQMWSVFANDIERMKKIHTMQPGLNSFNAAFLEDSDHEFHQAVLIFGTQAMLMLLTLNHVWANREDVFATFDVLRWSVSICGTLIVRYMCLQSRANFFDFVTIFPEYRSRHNTKHLVLYYLDRLSNCLAGKLVTLSTFFLLFMTNDNLDIVLNATALLFVLELDEMNVDASNPVWVRSVYRTYFMKDIVNEFIKSNRHYWDPHYLKTHSNNKIKDSSSDQNGYRIHTDSCSFLFPTKKK